MISAEDVGVIDQVFVLRLWQGPAQAGGHRSNELRHPPTLASILRFIHDHFEDLPTPELAGIVLYRFCEGQPFGDCNKRTGLLLATYLMECDGYELVRPPEETAEFLNRYATNSPSRENLVAWFAEGFRQEP